jgi:hypothetical protein
MECAKCKKAMKDNFHGNQIWSGNIFNTFIFNKIKNRELDGNLYARGISQVAQPRCKTAFPTSFAGYMQNNPAVFAWLLR